MTLIEAKQYYPVSGGPVIFLAGPISGAPMWQREAFDLIASRCPDAVVVSPRRFHSVEHYRYRPTDSLTGFHRQRAWERHYMDMAAVRGCVLFWLPAPASPLDGLVYGATTRYELGLWTARCHADPSLGLVVGTDGGFPTVHTIAYDLECELDGYQLETTLEGTVEAAVTLAREQYAAWADAGSPDLSHESELTVITHDQLCKAARSSLADNPMNDPDAIRAEAL